ncbi:FUSC family protein [Streptomyces sp. ISL-12]|uniref:FUSC family protein n=1 Tax=Streptomyces sp. ISL-12 TaxID=2819177 RepID=UPI001BE93421|nr:FUSC family protein [Streptomyces sp. ISL-12]
MTGLNEGAVRLVDMVRREVATAGRAVAAVVRGPGRERDLVKQSLKAAGAGLLAWLVAGVWMDDPMALMAPWVAVVLVQATVYSSVRQAAQQFAAICVGTLLASGAQELTDNTTVALAVSLPLLMLLANWPRFGAQGIYTATTAVFILASGTVSEYAVAHRLGQAALGAVIGVAVNALVLPPVHLRDVRENLALLARETGDVLHTVAEGLREDWDEQSVADWSSEAARLRYRVEALRSARAWSRESLRLTYGPLRALHRVPPASTVPPEEEDRRWGHIADNVTALTRTLAVTADEHRTPTPPEGPVLRLYARLLELIGDACRVEAERLRGDDGRNGPELPTREEMEDLHQRLQEGLREHAQRGSETAAVLGTLQLQAENLWAGTLPDGETARNAGTAPDGETARNARTAPDSETARNAGAMADGERR